jgi:type III restriction enzyme
MKFQSALDKWAQKKESQSFKRRMSKKSTFGRTTAMSSSLDINPILNNPYEEPQAYYATNLDGELDYEKVMPDRRIFTGTTTPIPTRQGQQTELIGPEQMTGYADLIPNLCRKEVRAWRDAGYPETTRVTKELLDFWFNNPARENFLRMFFAQKEAVETAIWINEVAERSNPGQNILRELEKTRKITQDSADHLPRTAFKMATGSGKTVVMAALTLYHYLNRQEYSNNPKFADYFLFVAPGVTIRDRLGVLRYNATGKDDYYQQRHLIPAKYLSKMGGLNARIVITNYHSFEPKVLTGNKKSPFDGKIGADGKKQDGKESFSNVCKKLLPNFKPGTRLLVINDEAHHCYLPKSTKARGENAEENDRAAVWYSGIRNLAARYKISNIYDLSATPYFLSGSGYDAYSLFPWIVSDFGLIEAIESGLVKIPYLPTSDDSQELDGPILRNLYDHCKDELPKDGAAASKAKRSAEGETHPVIPALLKTALDQFYSHYEKAFKGQNGEQLDFASTPPVFIVVCANTATSREVFRYLAGYELTGKDGTVIVHKGAFPHLSNFKGKHLLPKPPTLLIDSDALENSEQINDEFKDIFEPEIARFKADYTRIHGQGAVDKLTDGQILREVVNTVGKRNSLGSHIRCVVSVGMLTEGWDANTVTHITGLRAFNSQLLCEQIAGRALRRQRYKLTPHDTKTGEELPLDTKRTKDVIWKFPPEYAHIIGIPFRIFKGGSPPPPQPPDDTNQIFSLEERSKKEITFPNVIGYRVDYGKEPLTFDYTDVPAFKVDTTKIPPNATLGTAFSEKTEKISVQQVKGMREQAVIYRIARALLRMNFCDDDGNPRLQDFPKILEAASAWYETKVQVLGQSDPDLRKMVIFHDDKTLCQHLIQGINRHQKDKTTIRAILNHYNKTGSTRYVNGSTSRPVYPTRNSHVNYVVADTKSWEQRAAKTLDDMADDGKIDSYVKNAYLDFKIPYIKANGAEGRYEPDFLINVTGKSGKKITIILEVTGMNQDKSEKRFYTSERWLPSVNAICEHHGWRSWDWIETTNDDELKNLRVLVENMIAAH